MAIKSGMFNSVRDSLGNGDRKYEAGFFASYFSSFVGNGVFPNPSSGLQVFQKENMTTVVAAGKGWINGYYLINDGDFILQHENADGVLNRIDRIVMRCDLQSRNIDIYVKKGEFSSSPVPPILNRNGQFYELGLADVFINRGVVEITQAQITDLRLNNEICGFVHGLIEQVDTTTLFAQYESWYNQSIGQAGVAFEKMEQELREEFETWLASIKDVLSGDVAGNLASKILVLENQYDTLSTDYESNKPRWNDTTSVVDALKTMKLNKDAKGVFTTVEAYRKESGTLYQSSVLSGGESPKFNTRTVTTFDTDGTTILRVDVYSLSYDDDGALTSEV